MLFLMAFCRFIWLNKVFQAGNLSQIQPCCEHSSADNSSAKKLELQKKVATFFGHQIYSKVVINWWFIKFVILHICSINHQQMHSRLYFNLEVIFVVNFCVYHHRILYSNYLNIIPSYICSLMVISHWLWLVWYYDDWNLLLSSHFLPIMLVTYDDHDLLKAERNVPMVRVSWHFISDAFLQKLVPKFYWKPYLIKVNFLHQQRHHQMA